MIKKYQFRILIGLLLVGLIFAISFYAFVTRIQANFEENHQKNVERAKQATFLEKVTNVYSAVADQKYTIVRGLDRNGDRLIVWVSKHQIQHLYEADVVSETAIKAAFYETYPNKKILRIQPSVYERQYAWEVYDSNGYVYYSIESGVEMVRVQLSE